MLDVKKEMSFEEVQNLFSATHEFTAEDQSTADEKLFKITLTDEGPGYKNTCSTLMAKVNMQLLIRKIGQLTYNMAVKNYD